MYCHNQYPFPAAFFFKLKFLLNVTIANTFSSSSWSGILRTGRTCM